MRRALIGIGILTAACSGQPFSPASPSGVAGGGAHTQARGPIEVTFTKWGTGLSLPTHTGFAEGDVPGAFTATVLGRNPFENGTIVQLEARYEVAADHPEHSFKALIEGNLNNQTRKAVLNGTVIDGWLVGAQVQVTFDVLVPAPGTSCVPAAPPDKNCFQGTIRIMPGPTN